MPAGTTRRFTPTLLRALAAINVILRGPVMALRQIRHDSFDVVASSSEHRAGASGRCDFIAASWLERGRVHDTTLNTALTGPGSSIHRTKATTLAENGGSSMAG